MHFVSSSNSFEIPGRLQRDVRGTDCVAVQFAGPEDAVWEPLPQNEYWPICPAVGDYLSMHGCSADNYKASNWQAEYMWWRVVARAIMPSGPGVCGVVMLRVERVPGPFVETRVEGLGARGEGNASGSS